MTTLGERLRQAREDAGLSLGQAAKLLHWTAEAVVASERQAKENDHSELAKFAELYDVSEDWLREGAPPVTDDEVKASLVCVKPSWDELSEHDRNALRRFFVSIRDRPKKDPTP